MYYELTDRFIVPASAQETWAFFSAAENLPVITPPWLGFQIVGAPAGGIGQDALLDYTIRWAGVPVRWRTRIIDWSPPSQFIDLQLRGPYTLWHHQHRFRPAGDGGTECSDRVTYKIPLGPIGRIAHATLVQRQLREIFGFRRQAIAAHLGDIRPVQNEVQVRPIG